MEVSCFYKGRNLPWARQKAEETFGALKSYAAGFSGGDFQGDLAGYNEFVGGLKFVYALGLRKTDFPTKLPYLLANLHCPGVAAEALAQFDRNDLASHHPMSIKVLGPSSATRPHIERMRDTNSCYLHPEVEEWLVFQNPAHIAICVPSDFPHPGQGARALAPSCTASLGFKLCKRKPSWSHIIPWLKFCDLSS